MDFAFDFGSTLSIDESICLINGLLLSGAATTCAFRRRTEGPGA